MRASVRGRRPHQARGAGRLRARLCAVDAARTRASLPARARGSCEKKATPAATTSSWGWARSAGQRSHKSSRLLGKVGGRWILRAGRLVFRAGEVSIGHTSITDHGHQSAASPVRSGTLGPQAAQAASAASPRRPRGYVSAGRERDGPARRRRLHRGPKPLRRCREEGGVPARRLAATTFAEVDPASGESAETGQQPQAASDRTHDFAGRARAAQVTGRPAGSPRAAPRPRHAGGMQNATVVPHLSGPARPPGAHNREIARASVLHGPRLLQGRRRFHGCSFRTETFLELFSPSMVERPHELSNVRAAACCGVLPRFLPALDRR